MGHLFIQPVVDKNNMLHGRAKFVYNTHLEPHLFDAADQMRPLVIDALMLFVNSWLGYLQRLGIPIAASDIRDVVAYGSITNYYYDDDSDIDVVIYADWTKLNKAMPGVKIDGVGRALLFAWAKGFNLRILGRDVDMHIEDASILRDGFSMAKPGSMYSLMRRCWIRRPEMLPNDDVKQIRRDAMARYRKIRQTYYEIRLNKMGAEFIKEYVKQLKGERNQAIFDEKHIAQPVCATEMAYRMARKVGILDDLNARIAQQSVKNFDLSFLE